MTIHRLYVNTGRSVDITYKHCFRHFSDRWKENLKCTSGRLTGFTGYNIWPLGTIHLPFTLTNHDKGKMKTNLIDFVVIRPPAEHNIILGRTTILKFNVVPSMMSGIIKFSTIEGLGIVLATPLRELRCYEIMPPK